MIYDYLDPREERHARIAQKAANLCRNEHYDPTNALNKVASDNALNNAEVEDVCAKLNHILFQEKFAEDKMAVFNAAKYDNVTAISGESGNTGIGKAASYDPGQDAIDSLTKRAADIAAMPTEDALENVAPQPDPIMEDASNKYRSHEFSRFMDQTATNASEISAHHMAIDNIVTEMKERILALFREGVALEEIYDTILLSVGESQAPAVQQHFMQVIEELKAEGMIPQNKKVYFNDPEKIAADFSVDQRLSNMCKELVLNTNAAIIKEAAHEIAMDAMAAIGRSDIADIIDKNVEANRITDNLEKNAAQIPGGIKGVGDTIRETLKENQTNILGPVVLASTLTALSAAAMGMSEGYRELKRKKVKKLLPNLYPELRSIPDRQYSDLYDTITNLNPGLTRAPYAISEMIKRFSDYGTIDTGTALQLQSGSKPGPTFTDFAFTPARDAMSGIAQSYLGKPKAKDNTNDTNGTNGTNPLGTPQINIISKSSTKS